MWSNREQERRNHHDADYDLCILIDKRRIRLSPGLLRSASTALHLHACKANPGFHICLSESFSLDGSHATPKACRSMIASTHIVGASSLDSLCSESICRSSTQLYGLPDPTETALGAETPCTGLSRLTLGKRVDVRLPGKLRTWRPGFGVWNLLYGPRKRA